MMRKIDIPDTESAFSLVRPSLVRFGQPLEDRFQEYAKALPALALTHLSASPFKGGVEEGALLSLYSSRSKANLALKRVIREAGLPRCPYCGNPGKPRTIDHFIPKDDYPEFSIFPINLISCCSDCNRLKGEKVWGLGGSRVFFNPYYDEVLSNRVLDVTIAPDPILGFLQPIFNIAPNARILSENEVEICAEHIRVLDVIGNLREHFRSKYRTIHKKHKARGVRPVSEVKMQMMEDFQVESDVYGPNSWDALLYWSISEDQSCLSYLADLC